MDMDINSIITKIKQEGVNEGQKQSEEIIRDAKQKAEEILNSARQQEEDILKKAEEEAAKLKRNAEDAIKQASRDVLLGLRQSVISLFDKVLKKEISSNMTSDVLKKMLVNLAENFDRTGEKNQIEILLSEEEKKALDNTLFAELKEEMKKGVTLKASANVETGFRIGEKNGTSYYDFTDEAIMEAMKIYLNQKVASMLSTGAE
jgi:V/A-type H+-transporting ATPase subunit E